jgi:DNA-binding CsgD family transcriptional regulator
MSNLTTEQAAEILNVKPQTVRQYISNGVLERQGDGVTEQSVQAYLNHTDPDLELWRKVKAWAESDADALGERTHDQALVALDNRVKPGGKRRAVETAQELGVSRERVRAVLQAARAAYIEQAYSKAIDS